jgi:predicted MPP superfamily phosphohydrolase
VPVSGYFLSLVVRPSISWQTVHLFVILPLCVLGYIGYYLAVFGSRLAKRLKKEKPREEDGAGAAPGRRDFLKTAGSIGLGGILTFSAYAVVRQSVAPAVRKLGLKIPGLPKALHGFTIAHLTDVHLGLWATQRELSGAIAAAAAERPDMVIFTGDMVDRDPNVARQYGEPVERHLKDVPYGVYGVLGNHDHFNNPDFIARTLSSLGVRTLREERVNVPNLPLSLTGLDDQGVSHKNWFKRRSIVDEDSLAILNLSEITGPAPREGDFRILLNHRPEGFRQATLAGYGLYLVGHTHGGQYSVPGFTQANLAHLIYKYTSGLYHENGGFLNVSCGLASVGIPFRFGPWPEFSIITLEMA